MTLSLRTRRLIPKWRPVTKTLGSKDALPLRPRKAMQDTFDPAEFGNSVSVWRETKAPGALGDVLSFAAHSGLEKEVAEIGAEAMRLSAPMTAVQQLLITSLLHGDQAPLRIGYDTGEASSGKYPYQQAIRRLRELLKFSPDSPLALLDYAQLQTTVGKPQAAERALRSALSVAPNSRIVLRTLARFYVHQGKPEIAHSLLKSHPRTKEDPWLLASEIAVADVAQTTSQLIPKGRRLLLEKGLLSSAHLSELAGTLARVELLAGNMKKAREYQRLALLDPNDNVVAQALNSEKDFGVDLGTAKINVAISTSSEAQLLQAWLELDPGRAEACAIDWHRDEPFSSRPIQLLTSMYAQAGKFEEATRWVRAGLVADPNDQGLLVNLAYVQALTGDFGGANDTLRRVRSHYGADGERYALATQGLMSYMAHEYQEGDALYDAAFSSFQKNIGGGIAAFCRLNQAVAAAENGHPNSEAIIELANQALKLHPSLDSAMLVRIKSMPDINVSVAEESGKRRLNQWVFDPNSNILVEKSVVTSSKADSIVFLPKNKS